MPYYIKIINKNKLLTSSSSAVTFTQPNCHILTLCGTPIQLYLFWHHITDKILCHWFSVTNI